MTWVSALQLRRRLGLSPNSIRSLGEVKCLPLRLVHGRRQYYIEPHHTAAFLLNRFYTERAPCLTATACQEVKRVVDLLSGRPKIPPPDAFVNDAVNVILLEGLPLRPGTLMAFTGLTEDAAVQALRDWSGQHPSHEAFKAKGPRKRIGECEAAVFERLPSHLRAPPGTYLAPNGHEDDKPPQRIFCRLASIRNQKIFEAAYLDTLRLCAATATTMIAEKSLIMYVKLDAHLDGNDENDPHKIRAALDSMLGPDWVSKQKSSKNAPEIVARYSHAHERLATYIESVVPFEDRERFRQHLLTLPAGSDRFFARVKKAVQNYQKSSAANRQARIEHILDEPLEFLLVGRLRLNENVDLRNACRTEIDNIIKSGKELIEPHCFQHTYTTKLINEGFRRCQQTIHLSVWTWEMLHGRLREVNERLRNSLPMYAENQAEASSARSGFVIAYMGTTPTQPNGPIQAPLIAQVAESCILYTSGALTPDQIRQKTEALAAWQFGDGAALPAGLPWFEKKRRHAVVDALTLLTDKRADGVDAPVALIPHEEFAHGMMFAHAALFIAADAGCRTGETLLAPSQAAMFQAIVDPDTGEVFKQFDSIGKGGVPIQPMVSPDTFTYLTDMIIENAKRWHGGRLPPAVIPNSHFLKREIDTVSRYAFTVRERMINFSELASLFRILYFGWHGLKGHDVRHVFNAMGRRAGISGEIRSRLLNHTDPSTERLYGPATPNEKAQAQIKLNRQKSDNMARLLFSDLDGMTEEMAVALREYRLAERTIEFYEEGGWKAEADQARAKLHELADILARATAAQKGILDIVDVTDL